MLAIVMAEYAAIGMYLFGGKLRMEDPILANTTYGRSNYYANNFNDYASTLVTLFELLVVNNVSKKTWNLFFVKINNASIR
jgi:two pore calcium channel protein 2